jgi:orotate phosphoribosyltransferase
MMRDVQVQVAQALLASDAVVFMPQEPVTFKSGLRSPVYVDNRRLPFCPEQWRTVLQGFQQVITERGIAFDVIAGIEAGGIPHSSALGYILQKPCVFVRKKTKEHGLRSRVEGGSVANKSVLLIEDLVTTGTSSLAGVEALRGEGALVEDCLSIVSYGLAEAEEAFEAAGVRLYPLASFDVILREALQSGRLNRKAAEIVEGWMRDPHGWAKRHGG